MRGYPGAVSTAVDPVEPLKRALLSLIRETGVPSDFGTSVLPLTIPMRPGGPGESDRFFAILWEAEGSTPVSETVILVDKDDHNVGTMGKLLAHQRGELHRAFSVFVFDENGRWLLQKRNADKYHSGGLWTNTCCSHPGPGEETEVAAQGRLAVEMGITVPVSYAFRFTYRAELDHGLTEHEVDHVFFGRFDGTPQPHPREVSDWRWMNFEALQAELANEPEHFTHWFRLAVPMVRAHLERAS